MATSSRRRYTNEQWADIINAAMLRLPSENAASYPTPNAIPAAVAPYIDHTLLKLDATESQIDQLCAEAKRWNLKAVCIRASHVPRAAQTLHDNTPSILVASVVGFHEGTQSTAEKVAEATFAVRHGATELDMVINAVSLRAKNYVAVYDDILAVREVAGAPHQQQQQMTTLKCILETTALTREQVVAASLIAIEAGADYLKTSTGFVQGSRARVEDVRLLRWLADGRVGLGDGDGGDEGRRRVKVKASGGIRTVRDLMNMIEAGADRIGTSNGVGIMREVGGEVV
ncbi:MAG: hypothetical protein M1816_004037 [Peltula sp. TS41687]|nr:MAG: hypothetical protein M1816_004037 [Peltula sp. TS41687]